MAVSVLSDIIDHKRREVDAARRQTDIDTLRTRASARPAPRDFHGALTDAGPAGVRVIAEIKRMSPSAGLIRPEYADASFSPESIAARYHAGGAHAISCLTAERVFAGSLSFIDRIKDKVSLPVLRKDFVIDPWQVFESRAAGADAILLIAECLDDPSLVSLHALAQSLHMSVLVEVHDLENLARATTLVGAGTARGTLLGVNNRDLRTMAVDLEQTIRLASRLPVRSGVVSESGIRSKADLDHLAEHGVNIVLVGESLMRERDPGDALVRLIRGQ